MDKNQVVVEIEYLRNQLKEGICCKDCKNFLCKWINKNNPPCIQHTLEVLQDLQYDLED